MYWDGILISNLSITATGSSCKKRGIEINQSITLVPTKKAALVGRLFHTQQFRCIRVTVV